MIPLAPDPVDEFLDKHARAAPSLPIILFGAAFGIACGVIGFYLAYELAGWRIEWSVAAATLGLCLGLGGSGALLSSATNSNATLANIGMSCAVVVFSALFLALCMVIGALAASLLISFSV